MENIGSYLASELVRGSNPIVKSDDFAFGVLLLELITGRRAMEDSKIIEEESLIDWAKPLLSRAIEYGHYEGLVDPKLQNEYELQQMALIVACADPIIKRSSISRPSIEQWVDYEAPNSFLADDSYELYDQAHANLPKDVL
ncbi:proline-rich receptor-like protein kinase PERK1 [Telopea speciosissima]|uniref:proline-rich receptor-like protein kinase PERK1 n=1 Tax=Telopea speciosissima TaxID=54955 RepID=UPI001CC3F8E3|nr:proline-rich receptor-like protein kinase PERK1 [Telopea speciosissima]